MRLIERIRQGLPFDGTIELTPRCNLSCTHCYLGSQRNGRDLPRDLAMEIVDWLAAAGVQTVHLTGGEAILNPAFLEITMSLSQKGIRYTLASNGFALQSIIDQMDVRFAPQKVFLTLYALTESIGADVVGTDKYPECFLDSLHKLEARGIAFEVLFLLQHRNQRDLEKAATLMRFHGKKLNVSPFIHDALDGSPRTMLSVSPQDLESEMDKLHLECIGGERAIACLAYVSSFYMDWEGNFIFCPLERHDKLPFREYMRNPDSLQQFRCHRRVYHQRPSECQTCEYSTRCSLCGPYVRLCRTPTGVRALNCVAFRSGERWREDA